MPEAEAFKTIVQGGSFALLVLIFCWALFKLEPRMREREEKKDILHSELLKDAIKTFGETQQKTLSEMRILMESQQQKSTEAMNILIAKHADVLLKKDTECREERKENTEMVLREMELNRKSRHDFANQIQKIMIEVLEEGTQRGEDKAMKRATNMVRDQKD